MRKSHSAPKSDARGQGLPADLNLLKDLKDDINDDLNYVIGEISFGLGGK
ncbi:hypothetical protein Tco_0496088, partial [Tanacetum coccineum]